MTQNFYRAVKLNKDLGSYLPAFFLYRGFFSFLAWIQCNAKSANERARYFCIYS